MYVLMDLPTQRMFQASNYQFGIAPRNGLISDWYMYSYLIKSQTLLLALRCAVEPVSHPSLTSVFIVGHDCPRCRFQQGFRAKVSSLLIFNWYINLCIRLSIP
jgi:hypothetical protein